LQFVLVAFNRNMWNCNVRRSISVKLFFYRYFKTVLLAEFFVCTLLHLSPDTEVMWCIVITCRLSSSVVSEKKIKNRQHPFWHIWTSCFFCVFSVKLVRGPSSGHSYQVWFQLVRWCQRRRLKCLQTTTTRTMTTTDDKWWQYITWPLCRVTNVIMYKQKTLLIEQSSLTENTQKKQDVQMCQKGCCLFLIFFSETTGPIGTKLDDRNVHCMVF
jgi:hypothetical protein